MVNSEKAPLLQASAAPGQDAAGAGSGSANPKAGKAIVGAGSSINDDAGAAGEAPHARTFGSVMGVVHTKDLDEGALQPGKALSFWQGYLNLVRASIGPGCLSLPYAFSNAGTALAPVLLTALSLVIYVNMRTLVQLRRELQRRAAGGVHVWTLGDIGQAIGGPHGRTLVEIPLVLMELGICIVYFEFISTNIAATLPVSNHTTAAESHGSRARDRHAAAHPRDT